MEEHAGSLVNLLVALEPQWLRPYLPLEVVTGWLILAGWGALCPLAGNAFRLYIDNESGWAGAGLDLADCYPEYDACIGTYGSDKFVGVWGSK